MGKSEFWTIILLALGIAGIVSRLIGNAFFLTKIGQNNQEDF
jgi:hypothetical protein